MKVTSRLFMVSWERKKVYVAVFLVIYCSHDLTKNIPPGNHNADISGRIISL